MHKLNEKLTRLEKYIDDKVALLYPLPDSSQRSLVKFTPWLSVILGLLSLVNLNSLWHNAHTANSLVYYANTYSAVYHIPKVPVNLPHNFAFWVSIVLLIIEALLFLGAYKDAKRKLKSGWDLIYYALLINIVYGIFMLFSHYGGIGTLIARIIFSSVCFYFLFQVRELYKKPKAKKS